MRFFDYLDLQKAVFYAFLVAVLGAFYYAYTHF